jgi:toxin-antitoxin system PIN domain toxin
MPGSTTSFLFPDINVWVALTHGAHVHHLVAHDWFESLDGDPHLCFCRFTQLGLLRLLTAEAVMGDDVLQQPQAWAVYDRWLRDERVSVLSEPPGLDPAFRALTRQRQAAPKAWADAYLAAFAEAAQITLVTFDRAFRGKGKPVVVLEAD